MVFKGCQRCNGDIRVEEDVVSRAEDLVRLQCGHRQAVQETMAGPIVFIHKSSSKRERNLRHASSIVGDPVGRTAARGIWLLQTGALVAGLTD